MSLREFAASILTSGGRKRRPASRRKAADRNAPGVVLWEIGMATAACLGVALVVNLLLLAFDVRH